MSGGQGTNLYSPDATSAGTFGATENKFGNVLASSKVLGVKAWTVVQSKVNFPPVRSPTLFFGLGTEKPFSIPNLSDVIARLKLNALFYSSNYALLYLCLCGMSIITDPISLACLITTCVGWFFIVRGGSDPETDYVSLGSLRIKKTVAYIAMGVVSVFACIQLIGTLLGWSLWLALGLSLGHASCRDATALVDAAEAEKNKFEGEIGTFLDA